MKDYIKNYKHILGCVVLDRNYKETLEELVIGGVHMDTSMGGIYLTFFGTNEERWLRVPLFVDEDGNVIGDYNSYMSLYYKEYFDSDTKRLLF